MHVGNKLPFVALGIVNFDWIANQRPVMASNGVQQSVDDANTSTAASTAHVGNRRPHITGGIEAFHRAQTLAPGPVVPTDSVETAVQHANTDRGPTRGHGLDHSPLLKSWIEGFRRGQSRGAIETSHSVKNVIENGHAEGRSEFRRE